jgi:hypothetical protein
VLLPCLRVLSKARTHLFPVVSTAAGEKKSVQQTKLNIPSTSGLFTFAGLGSMAQSVQKNYHRAGI